MYLIFVIDDGLHLSFIKHFLQKKHVKKGEKSVFILKVAKFSGQSISKEHLRLTEMGTSLHPPILRPPSPLHLFTLGGGAPIFVTRVSGVLQFLSRQNL